MSMMASAIHINKKQVALLVAIVLFIFVIYNAQSWEGTANSYGSAGTRALKKEYPVLSVTELQRLCAWADDLWCDRLQQALEPFAPKYCQPKQRVGFLKTLKTGGSSVASILYRHALRNEQNVVLSPSEGGVSIWHLLNEDQTVEAELPWNSKYVLNKDYQIFADTTHWNKDLFKQLLGEDAYFFTSIRNPYTAFESYFSYFHMEERLNMDIHEFIQRYVNDLDVRAQYRDVINKATHLWFPEYDLDSTEVTFDLIKAMENDFKLILITEEMDKSLVLLSHDLCWPLWEMVALNIKERPKENKAQLAAIEQRDLKPVLLSDTFFHSYFLNTLQEKVYRFGTDRMDLYKEQLQNLRLYAEKKCRLSKDVVNGVWISESSRSFLEDCSLYAMDTKSLTSTVFDAQMDRWKRHHQ